MKQTRQQKPARHTSTANMEKFSIKEAVSYGWNTFKSRPWLFVQVGVLLFLINLAINLLQTVFEEGSRMGGDQIAFLAVVISTLLGMAASFLISMGETSFFLRAHDAVKEAALKDLWHPEGFLRFAAASLIAGLAIIVGFILLIVPGIILSILFMFVGYLVIEKGLGPIEALKESARMTEGHRMQLFLFGLALIGINLVGVLALLVGLLVSVPVSFLATVHVYRTLSKKDSEDSLEAAETLDAVPA